MPFDFSSGRDRAGGSLARLIAGLGPAMGPVRGVDALRGALGGAGALLAVLALAGVLVPGAGLTLPLAASAVLVFALPNAPLAQPWSVVVGNAGSAGVGLLAGALVPDPVFALPAAFGAALLLMSVLRALHPPGGAMAVTAAALMLQGQAGPGWALWPVGGESVLLVLAGLAWNGATGRVYPLRRSPPPRVLTDAGTLRTLLADFRQSANIGVTDLARIIAAAESDAAARRFDGLTCAGIMSPDVVAVAPDDSLTELGGLFARYGFGALPVVSGDRLTGLVTERDLIRRVMSQGPRGQVSELVEDMPPTLDAAAPVARLLPLLSDGRVRAVPILRDGRLAGIVTRSDLLALLAHELALRPDVRAEGAG